MGNVLLLLLFLLLLFLLLLFLTDLRRKTPKYQQDTDRH